MQRGLNPIPDLLERQEQPGQPDLLESGSAPPAADIVSTLAENHQLRAQLEQLRAERAPLLDTQQRVMELLGSAQPDQIIHDLRNLLNERTLFKSLIDAVERR